MIYCDSKHAELETCCDIPDGPVSIGADLVLITGYFNTVSCTVFFPQARFEFKTLSRLSTHSLVDMSVHYLALLASEANMTTE